MNAAEIIEREMQSDSRFQMRRFFAESVRQSRQPAKLHPHSEVLPFHKTSRDVLRIGVSLAHFGYDLHDWPWGVPRIGIVLAIIAKQFCELREVRICPKGFRYGKSVMVKCIGRELYTIRKAIVEVPQKRSSIGPRTLANPKRRNQFGLGINRNVNPLISDFRRVNVTQMATFFLHEAPQLINLQIFAGKISHSIIHQTRTVFASDNKQPHDGVAIQAREPFCAANRAALNKAVNRPRCCIGIRQHRVTRKFRVRFAESGFTGIAAPALNPVLTEVPKSLASLTLASEAGHGLSPLAFCGEKPQNQFGSGLRLTPRSGLAPTPVERRSRGTYSAIQIGGGGIVTSDLRRLSVLTTLSRSYLTPKVHSGHLSNCFFCG